MVISKRELQLQFDTVLQRPWVLQREDRFVGWLVAARKVNHKVGSTKAMLHAIILHRSCKSNLSLKRTPQQPRPWTRKRDFLPTQCSWLIAGPSCSLQSPGGDQIFSNIRQELSLLKNKASVTLQWIPSHCGVGGRKYWKQAGAICKPHVLQRSNLHTPCSTAKLSNNFRREWRQRLDTGTEEDSIHHLDRTAQVTIFRLRTRHCQLLSHLHRLKISHSDECLCGTGPQTPNHILRSCPTFDTLRRQTWPSLADAHRKLWGPVETLRHTADFALLTGLKI